MSTTEKMERTISDAFSGGTRLHRELRLDRSEAECVRATGARVREFAPAGDKVWYEISYVRKEEYHAD